MVQRGRAVGNAIVLPGIQLYGRERNYTIGNAIVLSGIQLQCRGLNRIKGVESRSKATLAAGEKEICVTVVSVVAYGFGGTQIILVASRAKRPLSRSVNQVRSDNGGGE
ncbi:hypothetical protein BASA50_003848 [Batrachochytrium salamandrivorans]|uniref:Uncharacterized protein n=1 Tax=Batrachochytrium salamandrivorans TaxID=1357716 RepID=A0ABQ8FIG0_9FUNG|nr:hypothetical protein BASA62_000589 [Batrachochytrium salamandrivorans]KAH6578556.1 hypothetical protein BASA60_003601 [Batrachochytrium salamandrivorans]KAH6590623.1 hypothetical protein BASA61_005214 [Batrachochytrium salamandrivorans]KAH6598234.1 hypothetical protein BASA50_003848 [Batrachochytrium salamandrivorans]KAH9251455.1 hypothetical protein BASA81_010692 [Batrachochytrium salamandrivorans]